MLKSINIIGKVIVCGIWYYIVVILSARQCIPTFNKCHSIQFVLTLTFLSDFKDRRGSSTDAESIKNMFKGLGFQVESQKDLSKAKLDKYDAVF